MYKVFSYNDTFFKHFITLQAKIFPNEPFPTKNQQVKAA
jgi:hypothetical protein